MSLPVAGQLPLFLLKLEIGLEAGPWKAPFIGGRPDGTRRFVHMAAIPKAAAGGQSPNFCEDDVQSFLLQPDLEFAKTRCVDDQSPAGQGNQLP